MLIVYVSLIVSWSLLLAAFIPDRIRYEREQNKRRRESEAIRRFTEAVTSSTSGYADMTETMRELNQTLEGLSRAFRTRPRRPIRTLEVNL